MITIEHDHSSDWDADTCGICHPGPLPIERLIGDAIHRAMCPNPNACAGALTPNERRAVQYASEYLIGAYHLIARGDR